MYFYLPNIINPIYSYTEQTRKMVSPPSQNSVAVSNQISFLIVYNFSSRLVTLLKVTDAYIQVSDTFDPTVSFKFINFRFKIFLLFVPEMPSNFTSYSN
jgi:hypothetical protein